MMVSLSAKGMGIGSSIAHSSRKYQPNKELTHSPKTRKAREIEVENEEDDDDLATVSSYRPITPVAHQDARAFTLDGPPSRWEGYGTHGNKLSSYENFEPSFHGNWNGYHGSLERGYRAVNGPYDTYSVRDPRFRAVTSYAGSNSYRLRTMQDVREYLIRNPQLLVGKKGKKMWESRDGELHGSNDHKQMKTKQNVYLGLINPPVIYGAGVSPDNRRLKVTQETYLNLVYPTMTTKENHNQIIAARSYPPLKQRNQGMVVMRKDDVQQSNGYIARPMSEMQVSRINLRNRRSTDSTVKEKHVPKHELFSLPIAPEQSRGESHSLPKINHRRRMNDYVDPPQPPTSHFVKSERQKARSKLMNGANRPDSSLGRSTPEQKESDEVVFTFNVDDLQLKKHSEIAHYERDRDMGQVIPLYLRKSLAYSPKYEYSDDLLSSPL